MDRYDCHSGPQTLEQQLLAYRNRVREIRAHIVRYRHDTHYFAAYRSYWRKRIKYYEDHCEWLEEQIRKENEDEDVS